ncbi:MAG: YfhO family protein [Pseudomonadota bacterium]
MTAASSPGDDADRDVGEGAGSSLVRDGHVRGTALALAILVVAWVWLTVPWWYQGLSIPWDSQNHFYAMLRGLARHLAVGDWPAWMSEIHGGRPTLADPQSMVTSPGFLLLAWFDPEPSLRAMDMLIAGHLLLGAAALAVLAVRSGAHPLAAALAAVIFAFGGASMARLQHTLLVISYAWLPVVMLTITWWLQRPQLWRGVIVGVTVAVLTVNRDHVAFLGHFVILATALAVIGGSPRPGRRLLQAMPSLAIALLVWAAIIALPLAATVVYVAESNRPAFDAAWAGLSGLPWASLLTLPFPDLFASLGEGEFYWGPSSEVWPMGGIDRAIVQISIGVTPAVILLWLGVLRGGLARPGARFGAAIALVAFVFALGYRTPFFEAVFETIPGFDLFRRPADATFVINLGLAFALVGVVDHYLRNGIEPVPRWRSIAEVVLAVGVVALALAIAFHFGRLDVAWQPVLTSTVLVMVTVVGLAIGAGRQPRARVWTVAALLTLTLAELSIHGSGTGLNARDPAEAAILDNPEADPLGRWLGDRMERHEAMGEPIRVEILGLGGSWQNAPLSIGVASTLGYNPLRSARYDEAVGAQDYSHLMWRPFGTLMTSYTSAFADLLGIRYVVLGGPMEDVEPAAGAAYPPPRRIGTGWVYENTDALPLAVLVGADAAHPHDPDALLASGDLPPLDWTREALIEGVPVPAVAPASDVSAGTVRVVEWGADRVRLQVDAERDAFVVWAELADPGWAAWVDGERKPISRANVLFMAVPVGPGAHEVTFDYAPWRAVAAAIGIDRSRTDDPG